MVIGFGSCECQCTCDNCQGVVWTSDPNWKPPTRKEIKRSHTLMKAFGSVARDKVNQVAIEVFRG